MPDFSLARASERLGGKRWAKRARRQSKAWAPKLTSKAPLLSRWMFFALLSTVQSSWLT